MSRLGPSLLGLLAVALVAGATAAGHTRATVLPSVYVDYDDDCVFTMRADGGFKLTSATAPGTTIPPGLYQVVLSVPQDSPSCPLLFQLQGPGVQLKWDFEGEALNAQSTETFQPGSTYVATDLRNPSRYRAVFSTATSGSSSTLVGPTPSTATGKEQSSDAVGSAILPYRGVLAVRLASVIALTAKGKAVRTLKPGRYRVTVDDTTARAGLALRKPNRTTLPLTGATFVGKRTTTLALRPGTWRFSAGGRAVQVVVA